MSGLKPHLLAGISLFGILCSAGVSYAQSAARIYKTYDAARRVVFEIGADPDGAGPLIRSMTQHEYDVNGQETKRSLGSGAQIDGSDFVPASVTETTYGPTGVKLRAVVYEAGSGTPTAITQMSYDALDRVDCQAVRMNPAVFTSLPADACTKGADGTAGPDRITKALYDLAGQITEVRQAVGTSSERSYTRYSYSANGKKASEKDANGNLSTYEYDIYDRLSKLNYPDVSFGAGTASTTDYEQYTYDANGNIKTWRRRDGAVISYSYDSLNHQTLKDLPGGTAGDVYSGYNLVGQVIYKRFVSPTGTGVSYVYDNSGRMTSTTDMNMRTVGFQYDAGSYRNRLTFPDGNYVGFGLDNAGRQSSVGYNATSGVLARRFDSVGRLTAEAKGVGQVSYAYDGTGRLSSMTNDLGGTDRDVTWSFTYNAASQITQRLASSLVYEFKETQSSTDNRAYDGLNRDAAIVPVSTSCSAGGYDARGNLICDGTRSLSYDVENRLTNVTGVSIPLTLEYDPEGRLSKYTAGANGTTFVYDGPNLIAEYNGATVARRYIHGSGNDDPVVWYEGSGTADLRYLYKNYQGSAIGYANASGALTEIYKYSPYGEPLVASGATPDAVTKSFSGSRFRYTGQQVLPEASLYFYKARVYDPIMGRFLQADPVGSKDDLNLYGYVGGDPVNRVDPNGLDAQVTIYSYDVMSGTDDRIWQPNHMYVVITDTDTGQTWIARGGPADKGVALITNKIKGTLYIRAEVTSVDKSQDTQVIAEGRKEVSYETSTVVKGVTGQELANKAVQYADHVNEQKIQYGSKANSNSVAHGEYKYLTGEDYSRPELWGSTTEIPPPAEETCRDLTNPAQSGACAP